MPFEGIHSRCFLLQQAHYLCIEAKCRSVRPHIFLQSHLARQDKNFLPTHVFIQFRSFHTHDHTFQNPFLRVSHASNAFLLCRLEQCRAPPCCFRGSSLIRPRKSLLLSLQFSSFIARIWPASVYKREAIRFAFGLATRSLWDQLCAKRFFFSLDFRAKSAFRR